VIIAGRVGYIAKGVALIAVGGGLISAAVQHRASQSQGLDGALNEMVKLPLGQALVAVVAVGFAAYGLYSFSRARRTKS
jgi:type IV secretory pathway VirB2 component (pilin)